MKTCFENPNPSLAFAGACLFLLGCSGSSSPPPPDEEASPSSCGSGVCEGAETVLDCPLDCTLSIAPKELWMHPNHWSVHKTGYVWAEDEAAWDTTMNSLDVFGVFGQTVAGTDGPFSFPLLKEKGIRIQVEVGGLRAPICDGTNYFYLVDKPIFDKLVAGGHENFLASMDAPFTYTVQDGFYSQCEIAYQLFLEGRGPDPATLGCKPQPSNCHFSIDRVADEVLEYLILFHAFYPSAEIGWIEPHPLMSYGAYPSAPSPVLGTPYPDFQIVIDVLTSKIEQHNLSHPESPVRLRFYHADAYFTGMVSSDGWEKQKAIAAHIRAKGMRFGILLNDYGNDSNSQIPQPLKDQKFAEGTLQYYDSWLAHGGELDDIVVESWKGDYPSLGVPEEQPHTFTNVMLEIVKRLVGSAEAAGK